MNARVTVTSNGVTAPRVLVPKEKYGRGLIQGEPQDISNTIVKVLSTNRRRKSMLLTLLKREYALQLTERSGAVRVLYRPPNTLLRIPVRVGERLRLVKIFAAGRWNDLAPEKSFELVLEGLDDALVEPDDLAVSDRDIIVGMARNLARFGPLLQEVEELDRNVKVGSRGAENGYDACMKEVMAVDGPTAAWLCQGDMDSSVRHLSETVRRTAKQNAAVSPEEFKATQRRMMQTARKGQLATQFLGQ